VDHVEADPVGDPGSEMSPPEPMPLARTPVGQLAGSSMWARGYSAPILHEPTESTPFALGEGDDSVPNGPLWAMKFLRHRQGGTQSDDDPMRLRVAIGDGAAAVYAIDDGDSHAMVARRVGSSPDGCLYCLVSRVERIDVEEVRSGLAPPFDIFSRGRELTLCGVFEGTVSNVVRVASYRRLKDVPSEYRPPADFIDFADTL
jgi:hypothetical protein